ncbi:MAG: hypothetical protein WC436_04330 [Candidatus Babeliales bacterium]
MVFKYPKFYIFLVLFITLTSLMSMENSESPIEVPERVSFLHDQIVFKRLGSSYYRSDAASLSAQYLINLNLQESASQTGIARIISHKPNLIVTQLFINFNGSGPDKIYADFGIFLVTNILQLDQLYSTGSISFKNDFTHLPTIPLCIQRSPNNPLIEILNVIAYRFLVRNKAEDDNICAICRAPVVTCTPENHLIFNEKTLLLHCGHFVHSREGSNLPRCPECKAIIRDRFLDFIEMPSGGR